MTGRDGAAAPILQRMYRRSIRYNYAGALVMMINSVVDGMSALGNWAGRPSRPSGW